MPSGRDATRRGGATTVTTHDLASFAYDTGAGIGRNDFITMQQAHDLIRHILENPSDHLAQSLPVADLARSIDRRADLIRDAHDLPQTVPSADALPDRELIVAPYRNIRDPNDSANKSLQRDLLKFIGNNHQDSLSIAICGAHNVTNHGSHQEISGSSHWTALNIKKVSNADGTTRLMIFHANSIGDHIPDGVYHIIDNLNAMIAECQSDLVGGDESALASLAGNGYIERIPGAAENDTNIMIARGAQLLASAGGYQIPDPIAVSCANQGANTAGFGNTCCENTIFNLFAMHFNNDFIELEAPSLKTVDGQRHHDNWNRFITNARPQLNAIIEANRDLLTGGSTRSASTAPDPTTPATVLSPDDALSCTLRLSAIEAAPSGSVPEDMGKMKQLHLLAQKVASSKASDSRNILRRINGSLESKFVNIIASLSYFRIDTPRELYSQFETYYQSQKGARTEEFNALMTAIDSLIEPHISAATDHAPSLQDGEGGFVAASNSPGGMAALMAAAKKTAPEMALPVTDAYDDGIAGPATVIDSRAPAPIGNNPSSIAQLITAGKISTTEQINRHLPFGSAEFYRPTVYSGIGANTSHSYNQAQQQFEFTINEICPEGFAGKCGLKPGDKITFRSSSNDVASLQQAIASIRQLAAASPAPTADFIHLIEVTNAAGVKDSSKTNNLRGNGTITEKGNPIICNNKSFKDISAAKAEIVAITQDTPKPDPAPIDATQTAAPERELPNTWQQKLGKIGGGNMRQALQDIANTGNSVPTR